MRALKISTALIMLTLFMITGYANAGTPPAIPTIHPGTPDASNQSAVPTVMPMPPGTTIMPTVVPTFVSTATNIPATPTPKAGGMDMLSLAIILIIVVAVIAAAGLYLIIRR